MNEIRDTLLRHCRSHHRDNQLWEQPDDQTGSLGSKSATTERGHLVSIQPGCAANTPSIALQPGSGHPSEAGETAIPFFARTPSASLETGNSTGDSENIFLDPLLPAQLGEAGRDQCTSWRDRWSGQFDPSWTGTNLDLDAVNLSLLQMQTLENPSTLNALESFAAPHVASNAEINLVQRKWHTFSELAPSGQTTPTLIQERSHMDEEYRRKLAESLRQQVQMGILPSTAFLVVPLSFRTAGSSAESHQDLCVEAYFKHFHPIFPIIHAPTFRPCTQKAVLLLSICSVGSLFLGSPRAIAHGISIYERLNKAILTSVRSFPFGCHELC